MEARDTDLSGKDVAMSSLPNYYLSPEEYLAIERQAEYKSEYVDGVMYAMAGDSERHNLIAGNLIAEFNVQLRKTDCRVYPSDLKVRVPNSRRFFYPDVSIVCGETQFADDERDVVLNPVVVVEVLSESTAAFDRGKKFQSYQLIESLREYLLVSQDEPVVEHFLRQDDGHWLYTKAGGPDEVLSLPTVKCQLALRDAYDKVA
ncbi:MAG: Uma2 family endonuclease [Acidobacteria bacterium]|nr:Uma2 family endonuclease [Acidobacteriota bacterium]